MHIKADKTYKWGLFELEVKTTDNLTPLKEGVYLLKTLDKNDRRKQMFWRTDFHIKIPKEDIANE